MGRASGCFGPWWKVKEEPRRSGSLPRSHSPGGGISLVPYTCGPIASHGPPPPTTSVMGVSFPAEQIPTTAMERFTLPPVTLNSTAALTFLSPGSVFLSIVARVTSTALHCLTSLAGW